MQKRSLACPLGFLSSKPQKKQISILDLNYDCYAEIFSYLNALDDKLNVARVHPKFREVLTRQAPRLFAKINMRMLRYPLDWDYLLRMCGDSVLECEIRHGRWDDNLTLPFLTLLNDHCKNMHHLHLIFVHTDLMQPTGNGNSNILEVFQKKDLKSLSLTDARAAIVLQLHKYTEIEALHIDGFDKELTNEDFTDQLKALPALRRLSLRFATRRDCPPLSVHCPLLEHLSLENFEATMEELGDFPQLKSLRLTWRMFVQLNNNIFRMLAKRYADHLEQLQLSTVKPDQVPYIVALNRLKMFACPIFPTQCLSHLGQLSQLECLVLQEINMLQLLDVVKNCTKLQHLKLGDSWLIAELEEFLSAVDDLMRSQMDRPKLLISLKRAAQPEFQKKISAQISPYFLQLDWQRSACSLCKPDRHSKHEVFLD